jgi:exopolysaccharide biosynthesis polyprenyl glycosylphosphotransferase
MALSAPVRTLETVMANPVLKRSQPALDPLGAERAPLTVIAANNASATVLDLHPSAEVYQRVAQTPATSSLQFTKLVIMAMDAVAVLLSIQLARVLAGGRLDPGQPSSFPLAAATLPVWAIALARQSLYKSRRITRGVDETVRIVRAVLTAVGGTAVLSVIAKVDLSRAWLMFVLVFAVVLLTAERFALRLWFRRARREGRMMRKVLIIGTNAEARAVFDHLRADPTLGYDAVGFIHDHDGDEALTSDLVLDAVRRVGAQGVIIAATSIDINTSNHLIRSLTEAGVHVELSSTLCDIAHDRLTVRPLGRFPMVYIEPVQRGGWRAGAKRGFDVLAASFMLLLALPVIALACIAVKLTSQGPMLFRQTRIGRDGKTFQLMKVRSMYEDAEERLAEIAHLNESQGPIFKIRNDPRITTVGRFLRKTSIDELPQLLNVLRGEMSLVGPRPALPREAERWDPSLHSRLRVRPGITGMWQVHGRGSDGSDYATLDLYYVDNWSLLADVGIMLRTIPAVVFRKGAF